MKILTFITTEVDSGKRLDAFLAGKIPETSRSSIQKSIKNGNVECDNKTCISPKTKLSPQSTINISIAPIIDDPIPLPENIPIDALYEDDDILVINKPSGIVVHPGDGCKSGTIVNALLHRYANFADFFENKFRPGIVHRLDKETSGCLLIAKNQKILEALINSFKRHETEKTYLAVVTGHLKNKKGTIKTQIGRHPVNRKKMAVIENGGKEAITHYEVLNEVLIEKTPLSCLKLNIETGRTHQIRVHMASHSCIWR